MPGLQRQLIPFIDKTEPLKDFPFISVVFLAAGIRAEPLGTALWGKSFEAFMALNSGFFYFIGFVFSTPGNCFRCPELPVFKAPLTRYVDTFSTARFYIKHAGRFRADLAPILSGIIRICRSPQDNILSTSWRALLELLGMLWVNEYSF